MGRRLPDVGKRYSEGLIEMAVTGTVPVVYDRHRHAQLPRGMKRFYLSDGVLVGDAGGDSVTLTVNLNNESDVAFQPWVVISAFAVRSQVAATTGGATLIPQNGDWEDFTVVGKSVAVAQFFQTTNLVTVAAWQGALNLGRVAAGTAGRLNIETQNVNTASLRYFLTGFASDHPIIGRSTARA